MSGKLGKEDLKSVEEIYEAVVVCLEELPEELRLNGKFGAWATSALSNILCKVMKGVGVTKEEFLNSLDRMWEEQDKLLKKVLN